MVSLCSLLINFALTREVLENKVTQRYSSGIRFKRVLPILVNIQAIERSFGSEILKGDISDVAGAARISLYESNVVSLDNVDVPCMLEELSQSRRVLQVGLTHDISDGCRHVETTDRDTGTSLVTNQILDKSMVGRTLHRYTFVSVCNLIW